MRRALIWTGLNFITTQPMTPGAAIHGPAFLVNPEREPSKVIVDWNYNAWGNKYPPYDKDDVIPTRIAKQFHLPVFNPGYRDGRRLS